MKISNKNDFDFKVLNQKTGNFLPDHFQPLRNLNFNR